ncbi:hypothetical protein HDU91_003510, partial [Kappamyces sp. JEL0680]
SAVSTSPAINFVLYIPPKATTPLRILHTDGTPLESNAFLIPQWGGIIVKNLDYSAKHVHLDSVQLQPILEIYAQQLRTLMGVEKTRIHNQERLLVVEVQSLANFGLTGWESDRLLRKMIVQNSRDTILTLNSLTSLLNSLESIIVKDHIRDLVDRSLSSLSKAAKDLAANEYGDAAAEAKSAIVHAEKAFFHPEMVAMLYFPTEHLMAIYMPFFVPIAVPMISALGREFKLWRAGRFKQKQD